LAVGRKNERISFFFFSIEYSSLLLCSFFWYIW